MLCPWPAEPPSRCVAPQGEAREEALVRRDAPPVRAALTDGEHRNDNGGIPTHQPGLTGADSLLDVQRPQQILNVRDHRLNLDHQQNATDRLMREQINPTAISIAVEADLGGNRPAQRTKPSGQPLAEPGMVRVAQSGELRSPESGVPIQPDVERGSDAPHAPYREPLGVSALQQAHQAAADASPASEILLPPATPVSKRSDDAAQGPVVHRPIVVEAGVSAGYRTLTGLGRHLVKTPWRPGQSPSVYSAP